MAPIYRKVSVERFLFTQHPPKAILSPKNLIVDKINNYMLDLLLGEEKNIFELRYLMFTQWMILIAGEDHG